MKKIRILTVIFSLCVFGKAHSQDLSSDSHTLGITIPSVAIVDIEPSDSKNITMVFTAPTEPGLSLGTPGNNTSLWLNYSFIPTAVNKKAKISVALSSTVPGVGISVQAATATGSGSGGALGEANSDPILLTTSSQDIITNIGASYTGDGISKGHNLTYSLSTAAAYEDLFAQTPSVTVTYTISE